MHAVSRRGFLGTSGAAAAWLISQQSVQAAGVSLDEIKTVAREAREALAPLPGKLSEEKWDEVRTVLKIRLGKFWQLGETANPIVQFAKSADEPELFELAEDLSTALQLADQFTCEMPCCALRPSPPCAAVHLTLL